jgi:hypothetical protein
MISLFWACDKATTPVPVQKKALEILSPTILEKYRPDQLMDLITQYDRTKYAGFVWDVSKDSGKTWEKMNLEDGYDSRAYDTVLDTNIRYSARRWYPNRNGIDGDMDINVKVKPYADESKALRKDHIKIRMENMLF